VTVEFIPFGVEHLDAAAAILAERQRRYRDLEPWIPEKYGEMAEARGLIERALRAGSGVAALRQGRVTGFLFGVHAVEAMERVAIVLPHGAAIAPGEAAELYRELYAAAAEGWLRNGYFVHYAHVASFDADALGAWASLGFGRYSVYNWRDLSPVTGPAAEIRIRRVFGDSLDEAQGVRARLRRYNATSPILHPLIPLVGPALDRYLASERALMEDPKNLHLLAFNQDEPVGLMTFTPPEPDYLLTPDDAVYLHIAFVDDDARAGGVGAALVNRGLEWAREQGYDLCTVGYFAPNILGARFWQSKGFKPIGYTLERRIDERIAWARG
jgi:GNAT superfamily N-acetyltransferase